ncbi:hypothetical protein ACI8AG_01955 [Blastococcus sp. SYSU DS0552]
MSSTRKVGLVVAATATAGWALFAVAVATGDPDDGANIGAGLAGLLALALSGIALVVLLASLRAPGDGSGRRRDARIGAPLAVVSLLLLAGFWFGSGSVPSVASEDVLRIVLGAGIVTFLASVACFVPSRPPRA